MLQALLTGMLGIQSQPTVGEVLAYLLYAIPMLPTCSGRAGAALRTRATAATAARWRSSLLVAARLRLAARAAEGGSGDGKAAESRSPTQGCQPATLKVPAGPTHLRGHQRRRDQVTEFEVLDGDHILGEVENLHRRADQVVLAQPRPGHLHHLLPGRRTTTKGALEVAGTAQVAASSPPTSRRSPDTATT